MIHLIVPDILERWQKYELSLYKTLYDYVNFDTKMRNLFINRPFNFVQLW